MNNVKFQSEANAVRLKISESTVSMQVSELSDLNALDLVQRGAVKEVLTTLTGKILLYGRNFKE